MPGTMKRNNMSPLLFLLLALPHFCAFEETDCSEKSEGIKCTTDFDRYITCTRSSTNVSENVDSVCEIHAKSTNRGLKLISSCQLKPVDGSRPVRHECTMDFLIHGRFKSYDEFSMTLRCNNSIQNVFNFRPAHHVKLNPPPQPKINSSTINLIGQAGPEDTEEDCYLHLQWKQDDQSWTDPPAASTKTKKPCYENYTEVLKTALLIRGQRYEARLRVKLSAGDRFCSAWSDWSAITSWESTVGKEKPMPTPPPVSDVTKSTLGMVACVVLFVVFIVLHKNKTTWIYIVKSIRLIPDPGKSSLFKDQNFQNRMDRYLTSETFLKPVEIIPVEVTSTLDAITPVQTEPREMKSESSFESTRSGFSNPSYPHFCPLPPISSLTVGNLEACDSDTPYGPVKSHSDSKMAEALRYEAKCTDEILRLLPGNRNNSEPTPVVSDNEKIERQVERTRFQSLDSGMCSGEEVSQESLEPDSTMTDVDEDEPEAKLERDELFVKEADIQKLFGFTFDQTPIQVCSGYEQVHKLQAESPEVLSLDSGNSSKGEDRESQESLEDADKCTESTGLLSSPSAASPSAVFPLNCSSPSFMQPSCDFSGRAMADLAKTLALLKSTGSVKPSGDGYLPAKQE